MQKKITHKIGDFS